MDLPEFLWDELFNLLVAFDYETQGGELTRAIADHSLLINRITEQECLESSEGCSNPEVNLLPDADSLS